MRKKFLIGMSIVTFLGVAAGSVVFNRTNAQDPPKKTETGEKKGEDLYDALKKALEGKKEVAPLPPLPATGSVPGVAVPPPLPQPPQQQAPLQQPPLPAVKDEKPAIPAPTPSTVAPPLEASSTTDPKPAPIPPVTGATTPTAEPKPIAPPVVADPPTRVQASPLQVQPAPAAQPKPDPQPPTVQITPSQPLAARMKDCPWSLHVDMIDGQTVITATVNKKHEFRIVCQSLDLQTGKGTLKAVGKVQITGDLMTGSCENLSIPLMEDRLLLEGGALVTIQKTSTNVSSERPASFELKGATLDLRISELQSTQLLQTGWRQPEGTRPVDVNIRRPEARTTSTRSKEWTPYGKLTPAKIDLGGKEMAWALQGADGRVIAYLLARDGGTLSQYEGQSIAVFGVSEQMAGRTMLRVSHIALP